MALVAYTDVDAWTGTTTAAGRQAELTACIAHAQDWIARQVGMRSLEKEATAVAIQLSGRYAEGGGTDLWLSPDVRPVWHSGSDLLTVSQDGSALTVAVGYSATADVTLRGAGTIKQAALIMPTKWSSLSADNVTVTCKVGFDPNPAATYLPVPQDVRRLVMEVAWLMFQSAAWIGRPNVSKAGAAITISNELSPIASGTLASLEVL